MAYSVNLDNSIVIVKHYKGPRAQNIRYVDITSCKYGRRFLRVIDVGRNRNEAEYVMGGDIVVTGQRPFLDYQPGLTDPYRNYLSSGTNDPWTQYYLSYYAAFAETYANAGAPASVTYSGSDPLAITNANNFQTEMNDLDAAMDSHAPFRVNIQGVGSITLAEIQKIFHKMDFRITKNIVYPNGRDETGKLASGDYYSNMDKATLSFYAAFGEGGMDFIAMHEIVHNTDAMNQYEQTLWNQYWDLRIIKPVGRTLLSFI